MALKIDLDKALLVQAIEAAIKAQQRVKNTTKQPEFIPIVEGVIHKYNAGLASIAETK